MDWLIWIFYGMVVGSIFIALPEIPQRVKSFRRGAKGIKYTPLTLLVLLGSAIGAFFLAEALPILKWGWLGYNIIFDPSGGEEGKGIGIGTTMILIIAFLGCFLFNYWEEKNFRESYPLVALWALLHLIMGISLWAVIPIFCSGLVLKHVYDKYSVDHAYVAHFTTNASLIILLIILLTVV
jgi:hypothetical protein